LIAGWGAGSAGTRSDILRSGLGQFSINPIEGLQSTHMQLSGMSVMDKTLVAGSALAGSTSTVVL
jgi:hypothetical protein